MALRVVERALESRVRGEQARDARKGAFGRGVATGDPRRGNERGDAVVGGLAGGPFDRFQHLLVLGRRVLEVG